jgi:hypothetical protein
VIEEGHETYDNHVSDVHEFFKQGRRKSPIIPIGMVIIDEKNKLVNTNQIDSSTLLKLNGSKREML